MIEVGRGVLLIVTFADAIDLMVDRSTMVITHLTSTGNSPLDVGGMPCTDTSNLAETLVRLARKLLGAPTSSDTVETMALCDGNNINHLVVLEDRADLNGLFEEAVGEPNLVGNAATIDLDLHQVGLLLLERGLGDLGVGEDADNCAVLLDAIELAGDGLAVVFGVLFGVLCESLPLALVPVLVESSLDLVAQVLGPDGGEGTQAARSLDVANQADGDHLMLLSASLSQLCPSLSYAYRRSLNDGNGLNNLLLVQLCARSVQVADNRGHAGLVPHRSGKVDWLLWIILGEAGRGGELQRTVFAAVWVNYLFTLPRCLAARLRGKNASEPWRGASNFL